MQREPDPPAGGSRTPVPLAVGCGVGEDDRRAEWPRVSVVLAVRNEEAFVRGCLSSLQLNDYPADRVEFLVVDGRSADRTRNIVELMAAEDARIKLIDNPGRTAARGVNLGLRECRGEIVVWVGGHADFSEDFLRASVQTLLEHPECWCVGGPTETVTTGVMGRTIAAVMSSPVGVGNARFRLGGFQGYVDTVAFASFWRWVFDKVGLLDEELVRNQDDDLSFRIIQAGGKIYLTPRIRSRYFPRSSLRGLARQYFEYGFWRVRTIQKHRRPATIRQIVPLCFVLAWMAIGLGSPWLGLARWAGVALGAAYGLWLAFGAALVWRRCGWREGMLAPVVTGVLHWANGLGALVGCMWLAWRRP